MTELVYSCTDDLVQASTPACATDYGYRVVMLLFTKNTFVIAGDNPTAGEFYEQYNNGTLVLLKGLTNGHRVLQGETEIEWHHKEWYDKEYRVEARIKLVSEAIVRACERMNRYRGLRMWFITERNYCFGGSGYKVNPMFTNILYRGKGNPVSVDFHTGYIAMGQDKASYDADYENLPSLVTYLLAEDDKRLTTEDGKYIIL